MFTYGRTVGLLTVVLAGATGGFAQQKRGEPEMQLRPALVRTEVAYPTGDRATSVVLLERFTPSEVRAGMDVEYQLKLTNLTRADLHDVLLTEQFPPNFTPRATGRRADVAGERQATWKWPLLSAGTAETIRVQGSTTGAGQLTFCATVSFSTVACANTNIVAPKLVLTKTLPPEVVICDPIPLHLTVRNVGTGGMRNVRITDALPDGLATADGLKGFMIDVGDLAAGQTREYNVDLRASKIGEITNTAQAQEEGGLKTDASAKIVVRQPMLAVSKHGPPLRYLGRPLTFEITVQNTGDAPARDTTLVDAVLAGTEFVSADSGGQFANGRVTWSLGTLAPGASKTVNVNLRAVGVTVLQNTAVAKAYCAEARASAPLEIRGVPAVLLEMVDDPDPIEIGGTTTYTIVVTNQGTADDTNIAITAIIPAEEDYVSSEGATMGRVDGKTVTFAPLPVLAPKAKATWKVVVKGNKEADVRFKVTLKSDTTGDVPVDKTESTHIY